MKKRLLISLSAFYIFIFSQAFAQEKPYFYEIPKAPEQYTAENVAARMVDGLGFRYFWATEGLRPQDLAYDPNDEARSTRQTLEHIYELSNIIVSASLHQAYISDKEFAKYTFEELRNKTLDNFKTVSEMLKKPDTRLADTKMIFNRADGTKNEVEYWFMLNGPLADALWHVGQVVSFRRSSGNSLPQGVSVFQGKKN